MTELKVIKIEGTKGFMKRTKVRAFVLDGVGEEGVTKNEFLSILDKASQPIKREAQSDLGKSGT